MLTAIPEYADPYKLLTVLFGIFTRSIVYPVPGILIRHHFCGFFDLDVPGQMLVHPGGCSEIVLHFPVIEVGEMRMVQIPSAPMPEVSLPGISLQWDVEMVSDEDGKVVFLCR